MPLIHSASKKAVSENIRSEREAGKPQEQAVAIALDVQRRAKRAAGGAVTAARATVDRINRARAEEQESPDLTLMEKDRLRATQDAAASGDYDARGSYKPLPFRRAAGGSVPWFVKQQASQMHRSGPLRSPVAGRTDHLPISVKSGSHVLPADVVSALGQGNTENGFRVLGKMFPAAKTPRLPMRLGKGFADGGDVEGEGEGVDILAAGGEHVLDPGQVLEVGGGDQKRGHAILDAFIKGVRAENIQTLRKLPGPARK